MQKGSRGREEAETGKVKGKGREEKAEREKYRLRNPYSSDCCIIYISLLYEQQDVMKNFILNSLINFSNIFHLSGELS